MPESEPLAMARLTRSERIFGGVNVALLAVFGLVMLVPLLVVLRQSLDVGAPTARSVQLIPSQLSLFYYRLVFSDQGIYRPFLNSAYITAVGTFVSVLFEAMGAYALSKRSLPGNRFFLTMILGTMLFSGGLMPLYIVVKTLGLINRLNTLILVTLCSGWNMILMRNYYWSLPESLAESARLDGADELAIFWRVVVPLSLPVIAAIALFTGVNYWNTFFYAVIFNNNPRAYTFPVKLNEVISVQQDMSNRFEQMAGASTILMQNLNAQGVSSAIIIVSMIPIIVVYPRLQRHFAKGILVGSLKG